MNSHQKIASTMSFVLCAAGLVAFSHAARAASPPDSEHVTRLLSDVKTQAVILSVDADTMEGYSRSGASWQSHASVISQMREHINKAGRELSELQDLRTSASPWQMKAIDRIRPPLQELANGTEREIKFISDNPERLSQGQYKEYLEANADVSSELAGMVGNYVDYGKTKNRLEMLAAKLELPATP